MNKSKLLSFSIMAIMFFSLSAQSDVLCVKNDLAVGGKRVIKLNEKIRVYSGSTCPSRFTKLMDILPKVETKGTLPAGMTVSGVDGSQGMIAVSLPIPAPEPIKNVKYVPVGAQVEGCPGTAESPKADPGVACVYVTSESKDLNVTARTLELKVGNNLLLDEESCVKAGFNWTDSACYLHDAEGKRIVDETKCDEMGGDINPEGYCVSDATTSAECPLTSSYSWKGSCSIKCGQAECATKKQCLAIDGEWEYQCYDGSEVIPAITDLNSCLKITDMEWRRAFCSATASDSIISDRGFIIEGPDVNLSGVLEKAGDEAGHCSYELHSLAATADPYNIVWAYTAPEAKK